MKLADFHIHSTDKLDGILAKCCEMVIEKNTQDPDYYGMVGACVLDTDNQPVFGVNHVVNKQGERDHAEVVAIKNYIKKYGKEPKDAIIITTLSPCSTDIDQPGGINCTDYIGDMGIKKVYCGYKDPNELHNDVFAHKTFHLKETRNFKLRELCKRMAETFLPKSD